MRTKLQSFLKDNPLLSKPLQSSPVCNHMVYFTIIFTTLCYICNPKKRNKKEAPDGLYWAPFFVSYNFKVQNELELLRDDNTIEAASILDTKINAFNVGIEVGYQFVFKKRFAFDMILIGPAFGYYKAKFDLDVTVQSESDYLEAIKDALANRIPLLGDLLENESVTSDGNLSAFKPGFRYVLQIGYRF